MKGFVVQRRVSNRAWGVSFGTETHHTAISGQDLKTVLNTAVGFVPVEHRTTMLRMFGMLVEHGGQTGAIATAGRPFAASIDIDLTGQVTSYRMEVTRCELL